MEEASVGRVYIGNGGDNMVITEGVSRVLRLCLMLSQRMLGFSLEKGILVCTTTYKGVHVDGIHRHSGN